jgi:hypothetical protein
MTAGERELMLNRLDENRRKLEELLPGIDPEKEVCPGWTIKQMLAHITGWDDACIDALRAHEYGRPPTFPVILSLDKYNEYTVSSRKNLTFDQTLKEWRLTRQVLRAIIEQFPEEKFFEPVAVPWGRKTTISELVEIFSDHEGEHARDIIEWLKHPETPLGKAGK